MSADNSNFIKRCIIFVQFYLRQVILRSYKSIIIKHDVIAVKLCCIFVTDKAARSAGDSRDSTQSSDPIRHRDVQALINEDSRLSK